MDPLGRPGTRDRPRRLLPVLRYLCALVALAGLVAPASYAQTPPDSAPPAPVPADSARSPGDAVPPPAGRPRVGLVLSGGGARGFAHIGVLEVLEELHIPIDAIAGTSMGAIVGGLYASGMSPARMRAELATLDWSDLFRNRPRRRELSFRRKADDRTFLLGIEVGVGRDGFRLPSALVAGHKINTHLKTLLIPVAGIDDFDRLPIPFRAVATDIETGEMVVLRHGDLGDALHASMAVPGVFMPVEIDGRMLVDGGLVRNLPADIARGMGVDVLILVDVGSTLAARDELNSLLDISSQVATIFTRANTRQQIAAAEAGDILIAPDLGDIGATAFRRGAEAVQAGVDAARARAPELARLALPADEYAAFIAQRRRDPDAPRIDFVNIEYHSRLAGRVLLERIRTRAGQPLDRERLEDDLTYLYGLGVFEGVGIRVLRQDSLTGIILRTPEKPWGPNYLRFRLGLADSFGGEAAYDIVASLLVPNLNAWGAELTTVGQLGDVRAISTELYQPLGGRGRFFLAPHATVSRRFRDLRGMRLPTARYRVRTADLGLDAGFHIGNWAELRTGLGRIYTDADPRIGGVDLPGVDALETGWTARFTIDRIDDPVFPRDGTMATVQLFSPRAYLGADHEYDRVSLDVRHAIPLGVHRLVLAASAGGTTRGELPFYDRFRLGGLLNLSGFQPDELEGQYFALGRVIYYRRLWRRLPFFGGVSIEAGNAWQSRRDIGPDDLIGAASILFGYDTPLGPLFLGLGWAEGGHRDGYLVFGRTF